ncbi:MAG: hypothetical protein ABI605_16705 [Rhizobacter sp.]
MNYSDAVVAEARTMRRTGLSARQIGARLGAPKTTVEGWLSARSRTRTGPPPRRFNTDAPHCVHSDEIVAEARAMREHGVTLRLISEQLGVARSTLDFWLYRPCRPIMK